MLLLTALLALQTPAIDGPVYEAAPPALAEPVAPPPAPVAPVAAPPVAPPVAPVAPAATAVVEERTRVFFSRVEAGAAASAGEADVLAEAILVSARRHADRWEVLGTHDVRNVLDVQASKEALGCDSVSCASEIADALNAPQLVTGTLGRVGETWVLSLSRIERANLGVLGRAQRQAEGEHPDVLLDAIPGLVDELLGEVAPPPFTAIGVGVAIGGVVVCAAGAASYFYASGQLEAGLAEPKLAARAPFKERGETAYVASMIAGGVGAALVLAGGALVVIGVQE